MARIALRMGWEDADCTTLKTSSGTEDPSFFWSSAFRVLIAVCIVSNNFCVASNPAFAAVNRAFSTVRFDNVTCVACELACAAFNSNFQ